LLLDEPFASLDLDTKSALLHEIGELAIRQPLTIILVSHDPHDARCLCHSALVVDGGRIIQAGSLHALFAEPSIP
jgi:ABC-type sulfate/molybdate transport systems ATPase subunit